MTWLISTMPGVAERLVDYQGRPTGHEILRGIVSGVYSGVYHGEPIGRASMSIYPVRKALEAHAMGDKVRARIEKDHRGILLRLFGFRCNGEFAYARLGFRGLEATIELPSDWHENRRAWVRIGLGFITLAFSFPWSTVVPDEGQCSGPEYGFKFHSDILWIYYGKSTGLRTDPVISINMPWQWRYVGKHALSGKETHKYHYVLKSWEVQKRTATIDSEESFSFRHWIPWTWTRRYINVEFDGEVGERTGSWKGGCTGCSYSMKPNETPVECLRRMERERKF